MIKLAFTLKPRGLRDFGRALLPKVLISWELQSKQVGNNKYEQDVRIILW